MDPRNRRTWTGKRGIYSCRFEIRSGGRSGNLENRRTRKQEIEKLVEGKRGIYCYVQTSSKKQEGVEEVFEKIVEIAKKLRRHRKRTKSKKRGGIFSFSDSDKKDVDEDVSGFFGGE